MNDNIPKSKVLLEEMLPSSSVPVRVLPLLMSSLRRYLWPNPKEGVAVPAGLSNRTLLSAAVCSALCVALSLTAVVAVQIAFSRVDRNNRLGLSQDCFYAISGWTFLLYDLFHSYVIGVFAFWLVRSLCWEAWIGGSALIISSLADIGSLSVDMFLQTPALSALAMVDLPDFPIRRQVMTLFVRLSTLLKHRLAWSDHFSLLARR
jgi:hypothetical protein